MIERLEQVLKQQYLKRNIYVWFAVHILVAVFGFFICIWGIYHLDLTEAESFFYGCGAMGMLVCAALYCGWLAQDKENVEDSYFVFVLMITVSEVVCFLSVCFLSLHGRGVGFVVQTVRILLEIFHLLYFFTIWGYFLSETKIDRHLVKGRILLARILFCFSLLAHLSTFWTRAFFWVNETGSLVYGRWYWTTDLFMYFIIVSIAVTLFQIRQKIRKKIGIFIVDFLPLLISAATHDINVACHCIQPAVYIIPLVVTNATYMNNQRLMRYRKESELGAAAVIQSSALPRQFVDDTEKSRYELYASMKPARETGGDFYDFFRIDKDHLALVIADVSDKGVPAALFAMTVRTLLRDRILQGGGLSEVLSGVNRSLQESNQAGQFVTLWVMIVDLSSGQAVEVNAGHTKPAYAPAGSPYQLVRNRHSLVLGAGNPAGYTVNSWQLQKGDRLFVYTDGVTEAMNLKQQEFGYERMLEVLNACGTVPQEEILSRVEGEVHAYAEGVEQSDDITMIGFTWLGTRQGGPEGDPDDPSDGTCQG